MLSHTRDGFVQPGAPRSAVGAWVSGYSFLSLEVTRSNRFPQLVAAGGKKIFQNCGEGGWLNVDAITQFRVAYPLRFLQRVGSLLLSCPCSFTPSQGIHFQQSCSRCVVRPTAPRPVPRVLHQILRDRIGVHVLQLLFHLPSRVHIGNPGTRRDVSCLSRALG